MPEPEDTAAPAGPDEVLRALADPHRREILRLVSTRSFPPGGLPPTSSSPSRPSASISPCSSGQGCWRNAGRAHVGCIRCAPNRSSRYVHCLTSSRWTPSIVSSSPSSKPIPAPRRKDQRDQRQRAHRRTPRDRVPLLHRPHPAGHLDRGARRPRRPAGWDVRSRLRRDRRPRELRRGRTPRRVVFTWGIPGTP